MDNKAIADMLAQSPLFGALGHRERIAVVARMRRVQFEPDQMVFSRGAPGRDLFIVLSGRIRLSILSREGRELTLGHAGPGQVFGEIASFDGGERTAGATAISRVQASALRQDVMTELIQRHPEIAAATIRFLCQRLRDTDRHIENIVLHRIEVRIARLMLSLLKQQARAPRNGGVLLDLGMSQSELGLLIGASRPKVNAALARLDEAGAIARSGSSYVCNICMLRELADEE